MESYIAAHGDTVAGSPKKLAFFPVFSIAPPPDPEIALRSIPGSLSFYLLADIHSLSPSCEYSYIILWIFHKKSHSPFRGTKCSIRSPLFPTSA